MLVIRLRHVPFMDITGLQTLQEVVEQLQRRGIEVRLCEANARVLGKLRKAGVIDAPQAAAYHPDFPAALSAAAAQA